MGRFWGQMCGAKGVARDEDFFVWVNFWCVEHDFVEVEGELIG